MKRFIVLLFISHLFIACTKDEPKEEQEEQETPDQVLDWEEDSDWEGELIFDID